MLENVPADEKQQDAANETKAEGKNQSRQKHTRSVRLRSLTKLRQSVDRGARESEIEKTKISEETPYDLKHAVTRISHMIYVYWNGRKRHHNSHDRGSEIK